MEWIFPIGLLALVVALCVFADDNPFTNLAMLGVVFGLPVAGLLFLFG